LDSGGKLLMCSLVLSLHFFLIALMLWLNGMMMVMIMCSLVLQGVVVCLVCMLSHAA
jgi:hypothetical protein